MTAGASARDPCGARLLSVTAREHDVRALARKLPRSLVANAAVATGHEDRLAREIGMRCPVQGAFVAMSQRACGERTTSSAISGGMPMRIG